MGVNEYQIFRQSVNVSNLDFGLAGYQVVITVVFQVVNSYSESNRISSLRAVFPPAAVR